MSREPLDNSMNTTMLLAIVGTCVVLFLAADYMKGSPQEAVPTLGSTDLQILSTCIKQVLPKLEKDVDHYQAMQRAAYHCHSLSYTALDLEDFRIRKLKLMDQSKEEPILLWTVVTITISGVVLAAYQVFVSFKLAEKLGSTDANVGGEASYAKDSGFVIKSSVTGLLILVVSFAFFLTYIHWVYRIETINTKFADNRPDEPLIVGIETTVSGASNVLEGIPNFIGGGLLPD